MKGNNKKKCDVFKQIFQIKPPPEKTNECQMTHQIQSKYFCPKVFFCSNYRKQSLHTEPKPEDEWRKKFDHTEECVRWNTKEATNMSKDRPLPTKDATYSGDIYRAEARARTYASFVNVLIF